MSDRLQQALADIDAELRASTDWGQVATYIPELARVPLHQFAIAVASAEGGLYSAGDADTGFSIQSISKVFALALALGRSGDQLWARVGREPSGSAFNSIVQLEYERGIPRNPFINAGAIVTTDEILAHRPPREALAELLTFVRTAADDDTIFINDAVAASERSHGHRNFALANFLYACGNLKNAPELTLGTYFHQCAIEMTARQLALAGRFLVAAPGMPRLISRARMRRLCAIMLTCGHYDASGDFAFRVGLPGKSGVGGGILAIVPGRASIAVWSPGLNANGNSKLGTEAMERLAAAMDWSVF
ncbi:glutaminase [Seohaeicola zhoushanensis]|uniref:Glutaminase n=1 Tax=Seohaeicola zhoushanensis TaxID=1569283 RepID=A0A8J3M783_9RHOB|nr:glutaminase [Seohaeicola zhoushanensis]GHF51075.1 glutaminase [Seohaeicola zhoushanensis]